MTRFVAWIRKTLQRRMSMRGSIIPYERNVFPRVYDSRLEDRRVLSASPVSPAVDLMALNLDAGALANDGQADRFELLSHTQPGGSSQVTISINHQQIWKGEAAQLSSIRFNGSADQDLFVIDPSIHLSDGVFIDGGSAPANAPDELVFAHSSDQVFSQINYQTLDGCTQIQFVSLAEGKSTAYQIHAVDSIIDANQANRRTLENHSSIQQWVVQSNDEWVANSNSADQRVELSSGQSRYVFVVPSERLIFDTRFSTAANNHLVLHDLRLTNSNEVSILGDASDTVHQDGLLSVGSVLQIHSGAIDIAGEIQASAGSLGFEAQSSLDFTNTASVLNSRGSVVAHADRLLHSGVIDVGGEGTITLDAGSTGRIIVDGSLLAVGDSQQQGGSVALFAAEIELLSKALIDASGGMGGGQILVGGDLRGANSSLHNATFTSLATGAALRADAGRLGDGGRIIVWASDSTLIEAAVSLSARGGSLAGDGGLIETSGKRYLKTRGIIDVSAVNGRAGNWLIDPSNVEIVAEVPVAPAADTSYLLASDINAALTAGTDVTIETNAAGGASGDITIHAAINASPASQAKLTLIAIRDIIFNQGVTSNSNVGLAIFANRHVDASSVALNQLNYLTINAGETVSLQSVNTAGGSNNAVVGQAIDIQAANIIATEAIKSLAGDIRLKATSAAAGNAIQIQELDSFGGDIEINAVSAVAFLGGANSVHATGGNGHLTLRGNLATTTIGLGTGAAGSFSLNDASIAAIGAGFDAGIQFGADGQVGNIVLKGSEHDYDQSITIKLDGGASLQLLSDLSTLEKSAVGKSIQIDGLAGSTIHLAADILTAGGDVSLTGGTLQVDGSAVRRISSGGIGPSVAQGGAIDLSGLTAIDGSGNAAELELDSRGSDHGGAVTLSTVTANGSGLNRLDIQTSGVLDGQVTLSGIRLLHQGGVAPLLRVNQADFSPQTIRVSGVIDLSTNQLGLSGGSVDFGRNVLGPAEAGSSLTILTGNTNTSAGVDGSNGGNVTLGGIGSAGGVYLDSVLIDSSAADSADNSGRLIFSGTTTASIAVDGSSGGNANLVGIELIGEVEVTLGGSLRLSTHPGVAVGFNSQAIDVRQAELVKAVNLVLDTSGGGNLPAVAGNVLIGDVGLGVRPTGLLVDTRGTTQGRLIVDDGDGAMSPTVVHVDGPLDLCNTIVELHDAALLVTHGNTNSLQLGAVLTSGGPRQLTLVSDADIEVSSINLSGGDLVASVDANNDQVGSRWRSTAAVTVGTLTLNGSGALNDIATIEGGLTTTLGAMQFSDWDKLGLLSDVQSAGGVTARNISGGIFLGDSADITAEDSIDFADTVSGIVLQGANGSVNTFDSHGNTSVIALAPVTTVNSTVQLSLLSDYSVNLGSVDLQSGALTVSLVAIPHRTMPSRR